MVEHPADPGFTVVDRRGRGGEEPSASRREAAADFTPPAPPPSPGLGPGPLRADLASLCVMFYGDALVHLGQVPDPTTGQPHRDLEQARFLIDLLAMLKEKTEGNRTAEESAVLQEILTTLRMGFVRASRSA